MKRFNSIKKSRKKSKDIDEKIEYLDKECQKTGLNEITMSTSGIYQGTTSNPNSGYAEITGKSFNGKGFAMSGDSNLGHGNFGGATIRADGAALSPPHPVTGQRRVAGTKGDLGSGGSKIARPGERPTPSSRMTGPILWYWNPSGGAGSGDWDALEYNAPEIHGNSPYPTYQAGWGYWGSGAFGFLLLRNDGAPFAPLFAALNDSEGNQFDPKDSIPETIVLTKDNLDDPNFLPIDVAKRFIAGLLGLAKEGFDYLRSKSPAGALDFALDLIASALGADGAKNNVDHYMRNFIPDLVSGKNPPGSNKDNPRDASGDFDDETISDYEEIYKDYQKEKNGEKGALDISWEDKYSLKARDNTDIGGTTGTLDPSAGDGFVDNGDGTETLRKAFDFDRFSDMIGSDAKTGLAAALYGIYSGVPFVLGKGKDGKSPTMYIGITFDKKTGKVIPNYKPGAVKESLDESVKLGHFDPEVLNVDINNIRKGIMPEFPKDPPKMINGYSAKSRLAPKTLKGEPFIKVTKKDLAALHILKDSEIKELLQQINLINAYLKNNPADLVYAQQRYPKDDIRLAKLNWQMDQQLQASEKYMETHFPENQKLFSKLQDKIVRNIKQTDPKNFTGHAEAPKFTDDDIEMSEQRKKIVGRYFKKPVKIKKLFKR